MFDNAGNSACKWKWQMVCEGAEHYGIWSVECRDELYEAVIPTEGCREMLWSAAFYIDERQENLMNIMLNQDVRDAVADDTGYKNCQELSGIIAL